jgi:hypothetical protein
MKAKHSRGTHLRRLPPEPAREVVEVAGETFQWELRHGWGAAPGEGYRGPSVSVWRERHQTRELIVDFPFERFGRERPSVARLAEALVVVIPAAIEAGWDPDSRGRAMRFVADTDD